MQLFELLITKSRNFLQRAFLLFTFPAFKVCCAVVLFWIDSLTKYTGMDVVFEVSAFAPGSFSRTVHFDLFH